MPTPTGSEGVFADEPLLLLPFATPLMLASKDLKWRKNTKV
jgi:hypothetical protein